MNINRLNHRFCATALGSVFFFAVGCSDKKTMTYVSPTADKTIREPAAAPAALAPGATALKAVAADQPGVVADVWFSIKDDTFAQRTHFSSGLQTMASDMDNLIAAMNSKQGMMSGGMMNSAMTEVSVARTNLQTASDKANQATADTWMSDKNMVAQAWVRMQAACTKAQSS